MYTRTRDASTRSARTQNTHVSPLRTLRVFVLIVYCTFSIEYGTTGAHRLERVRVPTGPSKTRESEAGPSTTSSLSSLDELCLWDSLRFRLTSREVCFCPFVPLSDWALSLIHI